MSKASAYNIRAKQGNTWPALTITLKRNGVAIDLTTCSAIVMWVVNAVGDTSALVTLTLAAGNMTITNAALGQFTINERVWTLPEGKYPYDVKFTIGGKVYNDYLQGYVVITPRITP